ncbi:peptidylprolyl isomerase [Flavobacterium terrae]|uniref:Periplasmic chaperone PpiD n=1 Tax=Flavobacterium terrae TaxID=415425 RepID=A0A1M6BKI9_9FLAO|nr:peptidylprolyl isomerase [Flavobacterium terrae]SHI49300.1 peptidyl-prolyl cis-trans isomerase D [Flavobacterium terrae]
MAVLSKIRQRSLLVIAIVGLSLFAFIIGALIENKGFGTGTRNAGTINGVDIPFEDFRIKVDNAQKSQQGVTMMQATNGVWEQEVRRVLLEGQYEKLGLRIGDDQLINLIKEDPQFAQNPQFLNAAGKFDKAKFNEFIGSIKNSSPERWQQWLAYEKSLSQFAVEQMYNTMVKSGFYTTQSEGKFNYELENNKVTFDLVSVPYSTIDDKKVELTNEEVLAYMKKNEKKYKAEESREIEFVLIEDKPSAEDEKAIKDKVNALMNSSVVYNATTGKNDTVAGFRNTTNVIDFVNTNSDIKYDSTYIAKKDLPVEHAEAIFNTPQGGTYGPYMFGDYYCISKSLGKKSAINAKASHILLSYKGAARSQATRTKEEAKAKAEELLAQLQANPGSFAMLAFTNSDDSSKQQGGDLGYFSKGQMTKNFENFVFGNPVGKIGLVETEFGYHIINVTDKQDGIRLATIAQKIIPSEATSDAVFTKATKFEMAANEKDFETAAKDNKLTIAPLAKVLALDENIQGIGNQREIVRWAFSAKEGEIKRFNTQAGSVVARLKKINEEGLMPIEDAKNAFGMKLRNEKKAKLIEVKMTGTTLEAVSKATGSPVKEAKDVAASGSFIETIGPEPKVVGTAFSLKTGVVSQTIAGNSGVFKIKVKSTVKAPAVKDYNEVASRVNSQSKGSAAGRVYGALRKNADIQDNRAEFN